MEEYFWNTLVCFLFPFCSSRLSCLPLSFSFCTAFGLWVCYSFSFSYSPFLFFFIFLLHRSFLSSCSLFSCSLLSLVFLFLFPFFLPFIFLFRFKISFFLYPSFQKMYRWGNFLEIVRRISLNPTHNLLVSCPRFPSRCLLQGLSNHKEVDSFLGTSIETSQIRPSWG